ncbi:hypothetical protein SSX86_013547 [Deinandra increscens subsp. villosa]|uniref:ABC transporter domain-containing protein n=1 Tax=Deinandra increscens subsp. villosa TaxID=3103831 RepID=A0AAP0GYF7_9ASTR
MEEENRVSIVRSIGRSLSRAAGSLGIEDVFSISGAGSRHTRSSRHSVEDEEALRWAALEKLSTYNRLRTTIFKPNYIQQEMPTDKMLLDVSELDPNARQQFIDSIFKVAEDDNGRFLRKFRDRVDKVGISLPSVEVRFQNLTIEADCYIGDRALPSLPNAARNIFESFLDFIGLSLSKKTKLTILKDVSGIIKPSRMTLMLGPPSSGKTTLLLALSDKLDPSLKVEGEITYNGHKLNEFVPRKTSAYISQNDVHVGEMTVKETLDFSARCQGVGSRLEMLMELARREKEAGILPEAEVDLFMKATAIEGDASNLITYYTLRILGLDVCRDTFVGDAMRRGISGGQKKRVTTGEMLVGPAKTLFMDEISTGLDSSSTFQIVKCLQQVVHLTESTIMISLLQPAPETFELFDDIILLSEGQIIYQGPRENAIEFFESCGFVCPERKGVADFLQEVTSRKDQEQYWADRNIPYRYIPVSEFVQRFKSFHVGQKLNNELAVPYDKNQSHKAALVFKKYLVSKMDLLKASWDKEWLLLKRNAFVYVFKSVQFLLLAVLGMTLFFRTKLHRRNEDDGSLYNGALLLSLLINMFNGLAEISLTVARVPVVFKQRDLLFHPTWVYTLPTFLLRLPITLLESTCWMGILYYGVGLAPEASRFFKHFLLVILIQNVGGSLFRLIAGLCRTMNIANTGGTLSLLLIFLLGGFILPKAQIPNWWEWATWVFPLLYGFRSFSINEFLAPRWMNKKSSNNVTSLGIAMLKSMDVPTNKGWYWIGAGSLLGFIILYNILFTFALMYLDAPGKPQAIISKEAHAGIEAQQDTNQQQRVPKIPEKYNPATWMLEVSSAAAEIRLDIDFAEHYKSSSLYQQNKALVLELSTPPSGAVDLHFETQYSQSSWGQFKTCIWKMWLSYWRNPDYNLLRNFFALAAALMIGTIFWKIGKKRESSSTVTAIIGAMYGSVFFVGMNNCQTVQPVISTERTVFYRERAAGMYSSFPYAMAQVLVEIPYVFFQATYYTLIVYAMVSFEWKADKFFWFFYIVFLTFLYFTYYGMMTVSITPNEQVAAVFAASFYTIFNLFSGFYIPRPRIPKWWVWYYWISPLGWTVYGFMVSQYHDVETKIRVLGMTNEMPMNSYIEHHYGFRPDYMGVVAAVLVGFCLLFASVYAISLRILNFQMR